ncbi:MAG: ATP-binding cassette domain-containing protein [Treponema sp.]|nr:ATP-binding cassette domain-containing protein [Treponema sp.]
MIELRNVDFSARDRRLVRDVSFRFEEGMVSAMVGPSGGGKSTVLKLAAGLCIPDRGEVLFRGREVSRMSRQENLAFRREGAFVFQDAALWANQTLFQMLELPLRVHFPSMGAGERRQRVESVVAEVGYRRELGVRPSELSMGEQKLLAFARALVCGPRLLFLDEWTESLDEKAAQNLIGIVRRMKGEGATVILVSHDPRIVRGLSDAVLLVSRGAISMRLTGEQIASDEDLGRFMEMGVE